MTIKSNGLVDIIAEEHSDTVYTLLSDGTTTINTERSVDVPRETDPTV